MKTYTSRHSRLTAAFTGCAKEISPSRARQKNLMIVPRRIASLERRQRRLKADALACKLALRFARKELTLLTQEDMTL